MSTCKPVQPVSRIDPEGRCPAFERGPVEAFLPRPNEKVADSHVVVPGQKLRVFANAPANGGGILSGLTTSGIGGSANQSPISFGFFGNR